MRYLIRNVPIPIASRCESVGKFFKYPEEPDLSEKRDRIKMSIFRILKKFRQILSRHQKIRILELAVIMVFGGFLEMLSVSLILPFMEAVMNPDKVMANRFVQIICGMFGIRIARTFLVFLGLVLAVIYIFKNIFLLWQMRIQNRFVYNNRFMVQQRLLKNYLGRPYEYYLGVDSGEVLRVINEDTIQTFHILSNLLSLFSELVVSVVLIGTVFFIAPGITIAMAGILVALLVLIVTVLRPLLTKAGVESQRSSARMNQWMMQAIQGIKELKIMRKESFFEESFREDGSVYVKSAYNYGVMSLIPRFMIEGISMSSILIIISVMIYRGTDLELIVPMLSSIAMAAIRLLPSVNRISQSMGVMAYGEPYLDKMIENLQDVSSYVDDKGEAEGEGSIRRLEREITLSGVTFRYPKGEFDVLQDASMTVEKGMSVGIIGPSGAGKTTSVDIMLGLLRPDQGQVLVDGTDIRLDMDGWLSEIGYIPQSIFMLNGNIRQNVAFGVPENEVSDEKVWMALKEAALDDYVRSLPDGLETELGERGIRLSGGQRQRVGIARALYNDPSVLFFDEATSALDNETEAAIMDSINHLHGSKTMIIIAHRLSTIEGCDAVFKVDGGSITRER